MAQRLTADQAPIRPLGRTYRWEEWADGQWWEFQRGEDFDVQPLAFGSAARMWGKKRGLKANVNIEGDIVQMRFFPMEETK